MRKGETWFTPRAMKITAIIVFVVDMLILLAWLGVGGYIAHGLGEYECFSHQTTPHFFILLHFALSFYFVTMIAKIDSQEESFFHRYGSMPLELPYHMYEPFSWFFISFVVLAGDIILLTWGVIERNSHASDECDAMRSIHVALDAVALCVSIVSVVWFIIFSFYTIRDKRID